MAVTDFEDMFAHVGGYGRYQKMLLVVSAHFNTIYAYVYFNQIFFTPTPDHWCRVPELMDLDMDLGTRRNLSIPLQVRDGKERFSQCQMYDVNYTQMLMGELSPNSSWPTVPCRSGWEYDTQEFYPTIVSQLDWVCAEDWKASAAQTVCFMGSMVGTILFGWAADRWGRLPVLVASNLLACVSTVATAFANSFLIFTLCRFVTGLSIDTFYTMMYIILQEYVSAEKRSVAANLPMAFFLTVGLVSLPWMAYFIWNWRTLALVLAIPFAAVILAPWFVPESGRWLLSKGRVDKAEKILRRVAKVNGKEVPESAYEEFRAAGRKLAAEKSQEHDSFLDLFRSPGLRKNVIIMTIVWMVTSVCYDGHVRNIDNLDYSLYLTFTIAGVLELPADIVTMVLLDHLGRRWTTALSLLLSGIVYLIAAAMAYGNPLPIACLAMLGRFFITMTLNGTLQYTMELVPTNLRGQGSSLVHVSGHLANCFAPYVVYLGTQDTLLPFLILGVASAAGGGLSLLLPETADLPLPNNVAEAERFGKDQSIFHIPYLRKRCPLPTPPLPDIHSDIRLDDEFDDLRSPVSTVPLITFCAANGHVKDSVLIG